MNGTEKFLAPWNCNRSCTGTDSVCKRKIKGKKIIAHCDTENVPSYKTMEKIGMHRVSESGDRKNKYSDEERREYIYELVC